MITEKEKQNREELFKLMRENPDLPVLPMVEGEVVGDDSYAYWAGSWGSAYIDEFAIDDWYGDGCVRFKSDHGEEILVEAIAENKYDGTDEDYIKAEKEAAGLWRKAIIVYIHTANIA